jgi:hypothetical protein
MLSRLLLLCVLLLLLPGPTVAVQGEWVGKTVGYAHCRGTGGSANVSTSNAGTDVAHTLSCTISPTDATTPIVLRQNTVVNACALLQIVTPATVPQLQFSLKACTVPGCATGTVTELVRNGTFLPSSNATSNGWVCMKTVVRAAPGAAVSTDSSFMTYPSALAGTPDSNTIAQPLPLNTLVGQTWTMHSQWLTNAGTGSSAALNAFIVTVTR